MSIFDSLSAHAVVPVIALDDPAAAIPLADALIEGGLPVAEITFRTAAARATIEAIAKARPELLVGAGTVLERGAGRPVGRRRRALRPVARPRYAAVLAHAASGAACPSRRGS
jgi:2-dehydro-3-deoxyphosphogluconate aldolase/(4S)-4-hydroxy-2-oxoglutarate aldolase